MILKQLLKSKLHHAHVTHANPEYIGSITIDVALMDGVGLEAGELVHVWAVDHKSRIQTYVIPGEMGSGVVAINGGGAHYFKEGDRIIIAAFALTDECIKPTVFLLNDKNEFVENLS